MNEKLNIDVKTLRPFTKFIYTIGELPTSYLMSMTYEEQLVWLCNYLSQTIIPTINNNAEAVKEVQDLVLELQEYINNYFDNLDVQEEINNKLDDMAEDGTLEEIIAAYLNTKAVFGYDSVNDMKAATNLIDGSYATTMGYFTPNDGGNALYYITDTQDNTKHQETLNNGLYANLIILDHVRPEMFGAKGDGVTNDTDAFTEMIKYKKDIIGTNGKKYYINSLNTNVDYLSMSGVDIITNSVSSSSSEIIDNVSKRMIQFSESGKFTFKNCSFKTYANQDTTTSWLTEYTTTPCSNVNFLHFLKGVDKLTVDNCKFENGIFDIWVTFDGTETLKGITDIKNCESTNSCIFYDSRWVLENNIDKCHVTQSNNATSNSHCIYITYGVGMKCNITNCSLSASSNGGLPLDIYHGSQYEVYVNNTNLITSNTSLDYVFLLAGLGSHGIIENCLIKSASKNTSLLYQGGDINENNNITFNNCKIDVGYLNKNLQISNLYATFLNCDMDIHGCYYNAGLSGNNMLKFNNCNINIDNILDFRNMEFMNCNIKSSVTATNQMPIYFRTKSTFIKNYITNISQINPNKFIGSAVTDSIMVSNIFNGYRENTGYNITETNSIYINIPS